MASVRDVALLKRLGGGEPLSSVAASQGWTTATMCNWFARTDSKLCAPYLMVFSPSRGRVPTEADVRIERDAKGIPQITGGSATDCAFGYGWCMSEDRLFQLDVLRRKATGGLSAALGGTGMLASLGDSRGPTAASELDALAASAGFATAAAAQWAASPPADRLLLQSFCDGLNGQLTATVKERKLPIEFTALQYEPAPFTPEELLALDLAAESPAEQLASDPAGWAWDPAKMDRLAARRNVGRHQLCVLADGSLGVLLDCPPPTATVGSTVGGSSPGAGLWSAVGALAGGCTACYNGQRWEAVTSTDAAPGGRTLTVLRSVGTVMPTAGAARVERPSASERLSEGVAARL